MLEKNGDYIHFCALVEVCLSLKYVFEKKLLESI